MLCFRFPDCPKEDEACQEDIVSLEAIKALHKQIDDDESGNIDKDESKEVCYLYYNAHEQNIEGKIHDCYVLVKLKETKCIWYVLCLSLCKSG